MAVLSNVFDALIRKTGVGNSLDNPKKLAGWTPAKGHQLSISMRCCGEGSEIEFAPRDACASFWLF